MRWVQAAEGNAKSKEKFVLSVAFSPDGRSIACGSMDGLVCIFDLATQQLRHKLTGHFKPVRSIAFTPGTFNSVAVLAEVSYGSARKLFMFIIKRHIYGIKVSKIK